MTLAHATATTMLPPLAPVTRLRPQIRVDQDLYDYWLRKIGPIAYVLYTGLVRHTHRKTGRCYPSVATLARTVGVSEPTVRKHLRILVKHGLISWQPRWDAAGDQTSHQYTVHPAEAPREAPPAAGPDAPRPEGGGSASNPRSVNPCPGGGSPACEEPLVQPPVRTSPPRCARKEEKARDDGPAVQRTIHYPLTAIETAAQERPVTEAQEAVLQTLDAPTVQALEAEALQVCQDEAGVQAGFVLRPYLRSVMYRLYQGHQRAQEGQLPSSSGEFVKKTAPCHGAQLTGEGQPAGGEV